MTLVVDAQDGPVVLVGHSYGGAVITEAGTDLKVAALAYIAAFAPDNGESANTLIANPAPGAPVPPIPPQDGFLFLDRDKFAASFAGDIPADQAAFLADSQVLWASTRSAGRSPSLPGGSSRAGSGRNRGQDDSPAGPARHV